MFEHASGSSDPTVEMRICNPSLSKYTPAQALERLRDQFKAYICAEDPFNYKMRSHEGPLQWWNAMSKDKYSDVLSVSSLLSRMSTLQYYSLHQEKTTWQYSAM